MPDPTVSPTPPVIQVSDPTPDPSTLTPGYRTSEAWITLLTIILGAIPTSGLTDNAPLFAKIVGMLIAALAAIHYTAQRTALKRAHLAQATALPSRKASQVAVSSVLVALIVALGTVNSSGCGAAPSIAAGGSTFLQCGKEDLTQFVGSKGLTLIATVYEDLASNDYAKLIADLITTVGSDAVGCAMVAIDSLNKTTTNAPLALTLRATRSQELIAKYGWYIDFFQPKK